MHDVNFGDDIYKKARGIFRNADLIILLISKNSPFLLYELGVADGSNVPTLIIADKFSNLPLAVTSRRFFYEMDFKSPFGLSGAHHMIATSLKYLSERDATRHSSFESALSSNELTLERSRLLKPFKTPQFNQNVNQQAQEFEDYVLNLLKSINGLDISTPTENNDTTFDVVIWNKREDYNFNLIANPIGVQIKFIQEMDKSNISRTIKIGKSYGLKTIVIFTAGNVRRSAITYASQRVNADGVSVIIFDRQDLSTIETTGDFLKIFAEKILNVAFGVSGDV